MEGLMNSGRAFSVLGLFDSAQQLMQAIPNVRSKVAGRLEAYTPFPIHGIDKAIGLKKSPICGMVLIMGVIGAILALGLQLWTSGIDYPQITAGKPVFSWEAFIPITFELVVLFATFTAALGMLVLLNRLPFFRHPMLRSKSMSHITRDKFALAVESDGENLDIESIASALRQNGAVSIDIIEAPDPVHPASPRFLMAVLMLIGLSCVGAGYITYWAMKLFPVSIPMVHMQDQPRLDPLSSSAFFEDRFGMRSPVPGTAMRGSIPHTVTSQDVANELVNPLAITKKILKQGKQAYADYCLVCHGMLGNGAPTLTSAYGAKPANLVSTSVIDLEDGRIYYAIVAGKNSMPSYVSDLTEFERWAAVHYVRVLQRAMNAKDSDVK
jgi:mono/diheme cytochrome c family protein